MVRAIRDVLAEAARASAELVSLAFPVDCVGCDAPGAALCAPCRVALHPHIQVHEVDTLAHDDIGASLRVYSGLAYDGVPARAIRALKSQARPSLARAFAPALGAALARWESEMDAAPASILVVAVPTSRASLRARGFRFIEIVARRAGVRPFAGLRLVRRTLDQRGLDRAQREVNLRSSMRARGVRGRCVVIIDDVVTTGATLAEAARALTDAGAVVVGAATIAATPRRVHAEHSGTGE